MISPAMLAAVAFGRRGAAAVVGGLPIDRATGVRAARSVARRLATAWTGSLIRVRRSSDNTESDIGYGANGNLDTASLAAFAGSGSAYVSCIYDQSGNGRDWTQAASASQPRIVNGGAVDTLYSAPCAVFDGTDDWMGNTVSAEFGANESLAWLGVGSVSYGASGNINWSTHVLLNSSPNAMDVTYTNLGNPQVVSVKGGSPAFKQHSYLITQTGSGTTLTTITLRENGNQQNQSSNPFKGLRLSVSPYTSVGLLIGSAYFSGSFAEGILLPAVAIAGSVANIESNQRAFWGL